MKFPRKCSNCNAPIAKQPRDELVIGSLTYCTILCRNLHLPSEHRRVRSLMLRALSARRLPDEVRKILRDALTAELAHG